MQCGRSESSGPPLPSPRHQPFACCWVHARDLYPAGAAPPSLRVPLWLPPDLSEMPDAEELIRFLLQSVLLSSRPSPWATPGRASASHMSLMSSSTPPGWPCCCPGLCLTQAGLWPPTCHSAALRVRHSALCHIFPDSTLTSNTCAPAPGHRPRPDLSLLTGLQVTLRPLRTGFAVPLGP